MVLFMGIPGRKSWVEEMEIKKRYSELTEPFFAFLKEMYESDDKADKKWASEQLSKAYIKMIPQDITSAGQPISLAVAQKKAKAILEDDK